MLYHISTRMYPKIIHYHNTSSISAWPPSTSLYYINCFLLVSSNFWTRISSLSHYNFIIWITSSLSSTLTSASTFNIAGRTAYSLALSTPRFWYVTEALIWTAYWNCWYCCYLPWISRMLPVGYALLTKLWVLLLLIACWLRNCFFFAISDLGAYY